MRSGPDEARGVEGVAPFQARLGRVASLVANLSAHRFVLLANNPDIGAEEIADVIRPDEDVVVQYNRCTLRHALDPARTRTLVFFYLRDLHGGAHGFTPRGQSDHDLSAYRWAHAVFLTSNRLMARGEPLPDEPPDVPVTSSLVDAVALAAPVVADDGRSVPSAGFASVCLLHLANVLRVLEGRDPAQILPLGFTGELRGGGFLGHDFAAEQRWLRSIPNLLSARLRGTDDADGATRDAFADHLARELAGLENDARSEIVFRIARAYYRSGDLARFNALTRTALSMDARNARSVLRWVDHGTPEDIAREDWAATNERANVLKARLKVRPSAAPQLADYEPIGRHAGYRPKTTDAKRLLIVNEPSALGDNQHHLGHRLAAETLWRMVAAVGIEIAGWVNASEGLAGLVGDDKELSFDGVLVNGDEAFAHRPGRVAEHLAIANALASDGRCAALFNCTPENGDVAALRGLGQGLSVVAVTDRPSVGSVTHVVRRVSLVPHILWAAVLPRRDDDGGRSAHGDGLHGPAALDVADGSDARPLEAWAARYDRPLLLMRGLHEALRRGVLRQYPDRALARALRPEHLSSRSILLCGEERGATLALMGGASVVFVAGEGSPMERLAQAIGLAHRIARPRELDALDPRAIDPSPVLSPYTADEASAVARYRDNAAATIEGFFADVAQLLTTAGARR